jgi:ATP-binding cassette subfamily C protein
MMLRLGKLLRLFRPADWLRFAVILAMMLGAAAVEMVGLGAVPLLVVIAADPVRARQHRFVQVALDRFGLDRSGEILLAGGLALIGFFLCRTLYLVLSYYIQDRICRNREVELSTRLFQAYLNAPYTYHLTHNSVLMLRTATQQVQYVITEVLNPLLNVTRQGLVMAAVVAMVVWQEPLVGAVTLACLSLAGLGFLAAVNRRMRDCGILEQELRGQQYRHVSEALSVVKELRLLGRLGHVRNRHHAIAEAVSRPVRFADTARRSTWPAMELIVVSVLMLAAVAVVRGERPLGELMPVLALFSMALARLKGSAAEFVAGITQMRYHLASVDAVWHDLQELEQRAAPAASAPAAGVARVLPFEEGITLDHVTFAYSPDRSPAIRDVSLHIRRSSSVAFVGPTGSGKTTLVDLIIGLLTPQAGSVLVDGRDLRGDTDVWQRRIGYIPQAITLIDDTLARNIAIGLPDDQIDPQCLAQAITAAQLRDTVDSLPQGLQTVIGERGVRLSGGQRQRIGIARALYANPDVLVMDEGTSALDTGTEQAVIEAVAALKGQRTIIMIAHRLSTVRDCDTLFFLQEGALTARGKHAELLAACPEFAAMAAAVRPLSP